MSATAKRWARTPLPTMQRHFFFCRFVPERVKKIEAAAARAMKLERKMWLPIHYFSPSQKLPNGRAPACWLLVVELLSICAAAKCALELSFRQVHDMRSTTTLNVTLVAHQINVLIRFSAHIDNAKYFAMDDVVSVPFACFYNFLRGSSSSSCKYFFRKFLFHIFRNSTILVAYISERCIGWLADLWICWLKFLSKSNTEVPFVPYEYGRN